MKIRTVVFLFSLSLLISNCSSQKTLSIVGQSSYSFTKEITKQVKVNYWLYIPEAYETDDKKWPLMLFLHGAGERGTDLEKVKVHGPPKLIDEGKTFPFIIVSPQCPEGQYWSIESLDLLLNDIVENYNVDLDRIYVTGLSMGGYGTWTLATEFPNRFAAIAPVCGGGNPNLAHLIKDVPAWIFHGEKDMVVPIKQSQMMVDAIKKVGGNPMFTKYPEANHDSWTETYNNDDLYDWFLKQNRKKRIGNY